MKRTSDQLTDAPAAPAKKAKRLTLSERMKFVTNGTDAVPTTKPKVILMSTGSDVYNKQTMTRECFNRFGYNVWTIADCFVGDVEVGDIVMSTASGEDNYQTLHVVTGIKEITRDIYHNLYKPIKVVDGSRKDYRTHILTLGNRKEISIPKNTTHTSLGFKGLQCMHPLQGHFHGNLSKTSVPYKWCKKNGFPISQVLDNYTALRNTCVKLVAC